MKIFVVFSVVVGARGESAEPFLEGVAPSRVRALALRAERQAPGIHAWIQETTVYDGGREHPPGARVR